MINSYPVQNQKVLVAMSGGVDSSVAVYLLQQDGFEPVGVTFKLWCHSVADHPKRVVESARDISRKLGVEHYVLNIEKEFEETVVQQFVDDYLEGITPNPCVFCNRQIKWRNLLDFADQHAIPFVATGHYARIMDNESTGRFEIQRGIDKRKDQSYMLWQLSQKALRRTIFPVGGYLKKDVQKVAQDMGFPMIDQKESQDICFLPDNDYREFLRSYAPRQIAPVGGGELIDEAGNVLGYHDGFYHFTIGQRKGFKMGFAKRKYVKAIDARKNLVVIADNDRLFSRKMLIRDVRWVSSAPVKQTAGLLKIRYNHKGVPSTLKSIGNGHWLVEFREPQRAVTPGQSAVLYREEKLILGGIIVKSMDD
jgi:tRNA-specific 2-thiouridylase